MKKKSLFLVLFELSKYLLVEEKKNNYLLKKHKIMETIFKVELSEKRNSTNNVTISCKFNERFDSFFLTVKKNNKVNWDEVETRIEEVKHDVTRMIEEGYSRRRINLEYKF